ncbi:YlcG family protein, partial [Mycobacterium tuberculosis]|nr:YlcG family protein [Mycobacterium tuberculosis]
PAANQIHIHPQSPRAGKAPRPPSGGRMSRDVIERIRDRWQKLRLLRSRGTVLVDYKILRNFVRIYKRLGEEA